MKTILFVFCGFLLTGCSGLTDAVASGSGLTASVLAELSPTLALFDERLGAVAVDVASVASTAHEATVTASVAKDAAGEGKELGYEEWGKILATVTGGVVALNLKRNAAAAKT